MDVEKLDALTRLATGLRFYEQWSDMDPADYIHYAVDEDPCPFRPDELKHRLVWFNDRGNVVEKWGWDSVPEGQNEVAVLTLYFLEDMLAHDRNELIAQLKDFPSGIDWLAKLYGIVQTQMNGPLWHEDGTVGLKVDDDKLLEELRPICFFFDAVQRLMRPQEPSSRPRTITQAMILRRLRICKDPARQQVARARSTISTWVKKDDFPKCMTWGKVRQWILDNKHVDIGEP